MIHKKFLLLTLPLDVCPYAKIVPLMPLRALETIGLATSSKRSAVARVSSKILSGCLKKNKHGHEIKNCS